MNAIRIALVVCLLRLLGCTANKPYRTDIAVSSDPDHPNHHAVIESTPSYKLGFIELDDEGEFFNIERRNAVEGMVRDQAKLNSHGTNAAPQPIVLVVFVHGWKENADYDDYCVVGFRKMLLKLASIEKAAEHFNLRPARPVVGVYIGWRGLSATWEPFKELSFWERKDIAHKVGGYGAMTQVLVDMENIQKRCNIHPDDSTDRTELIIIGHSFGAAAVYSALSQIITERMINTLWMSPPTTLKPLGDQVILLNPAFEAQRHADLNQMVTNVPAYPPHQLPVLSIFTSKTDWATHYIFPLGRFFATLFDDNRGEEYNAGLQTIGWYEPYETHRLIMPDTARPISSPLPPSTAPSRETLESFNRVRGERLKWKPNTRTNEPILLPNTTLIPNPSYKTGNPVWVVSVDRTIMDGHNDIFNDNLIDFLGDYVEFCRTGTAPPPTTLPTPTTQPVSMLESSPRLH